MVELIHPSYPIDLSRAAEKGLSEKGIPTLPFCPAEASRAAEADLPEEVANKIVVLLHSNAVRDLAIEDKLTLGLIRPNAGPEANQEGMEDGKIADHIERYMITRLGVLAKFSFTFTPEDVNNFYDDDLHGRPRWDEFVSAMSSGRTTALLPHNPNSDAIETWRSQVGPWDRTEPETIRGRLAVSDVHNLVHGSDEPEEVLRELDAIANCVAKANNLRNPSSVDC